MTHELKILSVYYEAVKEGRKTFEVRKNDRNFKNNDIVILKEFHHMDGYTGWEIKKRIGYVFRLDNIMGIETDMVVFSLLDEVD